MLISDSEGNFLTAGGGGGILLDRYQTQNIKFSGGDILMLREKSPPPSGHLPNSSLFLRYYNLDGWRGGGGGKTRASVLV